MNIDEGIFTSKSQLPVTQLNYGGSSNRFSWILYKIDFLECHGKSDDGEYPSERNSNRFAAIETDIEENKDSIEENQNNIEENHNNINAVEYDAQHNENEIVALKSRTTTLEGTVFQTDYYFKYYQIS